ncbi:MAG: NAD-dependent epimerase/dehydratase family protein, partial [Eggerthellaceae bacterium]|nr:NAD-dependent epimerase/dehydratase family protein [Eggerthellaceae bacterium]
MSNKSLSGTHKSQTILVTGGAGFIGSHTCVEVLEQGYNIVI